MRTFNSLRRTATALVALALCFVADIVQADNAPLDLLVGRWDVRIETLKPEPKTVTYRDTFRWVLGGQYLEGRSENRSDGAEDISYGRYDAQSRGYTFWIFSSSGDFTYLPSGSWDARRRTLHWKNPPNFDLEYNTILEFPDNKTRRWSVEFKDWKGSVVFQQNGYAVRRSAQ